MSVRYLYTVLIALILLGCSSHEELPPPNNPFDPGNPDYVDPEAEIISGPTEGEIIYSTSVTMVWEGNESATEYRYKFDSNSWSDWGETTSQTFEYLDEGTHGLELQARSVNGDEQTNSTLLNFIVDAVSGPSAIVYPYLQKATAGDTLIYQLIAEEVTNLFAIEINISFNEQYLELIDVIDGEILDEWGGEVLRFQEVTDSNISLSIVAVEGVSTSFSGTISIVSIMVELTSAIDLSTAVDVINPFQVVYLNSNLEAIPVMEHREGVLTGE